jgi:hypothetical protein
MLRYVCVIMATQKPTSGILSAAQMYYDGIASDCITVENTFGRLKTLWVVSSTIYSRAARAASSSSTDTSPSRTSTSFSCRYARPILRVACVATTGVKIKRRRKKLMQRLHQIMPPPSATTPRTCTTSRIKSTFWIAWTIRFCVVLRSLYVNIPVAILYVWGSS